MTKIVRLCVLALIVIVFAAGVEAKKKPKKEEEPAGTMSAGTFSGLTFRLLGPALTSGRVSDIAVHPGDRSRYFVAAASGGVWLTANAGTTWTPVFD
ncbi:MAG: hypothetical protein R3344_13835, partial [Acidobacteriota bacterium]|nr:hypothetical protein [Acidobacteriota bacterium]